MTTQPQQSIQKPTTTKAPLVSIRDLLESRKQQFAELLPKHLTPDRLIKVALNCISKIPKLQGCTAASLFGAITVAAELGLEPGGALGHLYLVPYGTTCTPIIGYRGFIELARRSGQLAQIEAHVVHEGDDLELEFGLEPKLSHRPKLEGAAGRATLVYCIARMKDGAQHVEVMTIEAVEKIRARSRAAKEGPWVTDYEEMAKKTVVRRAAKYLPLSAELARAIEIDDEDYVDGEVVAPKALAADNALVDEVATSKVAQTKAKLKAKSGPVIDVQEGQSEEEALAQHASQNEPPPDMALPTMADQPSHP